jgi:hypothetical protein
MSAPVFVLALGPGRLPDRAIGVRLHRAADELRAADPDAGRVAMVLDAMARAVRSRDRSAGGVDVGGMDDADRAGVTAPSRWPSTRTSRTEPPRRCGWVRVLCEWQSFTRDPGNKRETGEERPGR